MRAALVSAVDECTGKRARSSLHRAAGKFVIAINEDIDPTNADALLWAMSYRANASLDMHVLPHRDQGHGPRSLRNNAGFTRSSRPLPAR